MGYHELARPRAFTELTGGAELSPFVQNYVIGFDQDKSVIVRLTDSVHILLIDSRHPI